jgi:hypothetical protein
MQTDNKTLLDNVERALQLAVDPDLTKAQRKQYRAQGMELRARLVTLLSLEFADGTQQVRDANGKIKEVNALLKQKLKDLQGVAKTVKALGDLVGVVDDLLKLSATFI